MAAGRALALLVFVLAAVALPACGGGEEEKAAPTVTAVASPTATATTATTATATATPRPSPTAAPTPRPGGQTPAPTPSWQTAAPREPVPAGEVVDLGIRNKNGAPGKTYAIGVQVNLPDGSPVNMDGQAVGDEWAYFSISETNLPGTYTVYFGLPQSDIIYAEDSFHVYSPEPVTPSWQTSAPRAPVAIGQVVEIGLRNEYGQPEECYIFQVEVYDPLEDYTSAEDTVCADEWTTLTYEDTFVSGTYDVYFSIEGQYIAQDFFEVSEE